MMMGDELWNKYMVCDLYEAAIDFGNGVVTLYIGLEQCSDMSGAIAVARQLCPFVREVRVMQRNSTLVSRYYTSKGNQINGWLSAAREGTL